MLQKLPGTELQGKVKFLWYWTYPATKLIKTGIGVVSQESTSSAPHDKNENLLQCLIPHCPHVDLPRGKFYNACIEFYISFFASV
jgi:hypothetical protein